MPSQRLINIQAVESTRDLPFSVPQNRNQSYGSGSGFPEPPRVSLEEIDRRVGGLYVPTFIPDGFALTASDAQGSTMAFLRYHEQDKTFKQIISFAQFGNPGYPTIQSGNFRVAQVGSKPGYIIDGGWVVREDEKGTLSIQWENGHRQVLMWERDDSWTLLAIEYPAPTDEDSSALLLEIGESFVRFS